MCWTSFIGSVMPHQGPNDSIIFSVFVLISTPYIYSTSCTTKLLFHPISTNHTIQLILVSYCNLVMATCAKIEFIILFLLLFSLRAMFALFYICKKLIFYL